MKKTLAIILGMALILPFPKGWAAQDDARGIRIKNKAELHHGSGKIGQYTALVIGINDYADENIPDLKTAVHDARTMAGILKDRYGFGKTILMTDREADKAGMVKAFRNLIRELGPNDNLLIYYAGHGELDSLIGGDGWWVPADARAGDITSYFENTTVQKYIKAMKARHVLLVSDSCYSGTLFGESRSLPKQIDDRFYLDLYNMKSRWGMTSGNKTPVSDAGFEGHSVFAYSLINKLQQNRKPYLTPREIYTDIGPVVRNNSEQMPMCNPIKMTGDAGGEFVFILADSGGTTVITSKPVKKESKLKVTSDVSGSSVWINGTKYDGYAPKEFTIKSSGKYTVKVTANGYKDYEKTEYIEIGKDVVVQAYLEKEKPPSGPDVGDVWKGIQLGKLPFYWDQQQKSNQQLDQKNIYITNLSLMDSMTRTIIAVTYPQDLMNKFIVQEIYQTMKRHPYLKYNEPGHTIEDTDENVLWLNDVVFDREKTPEMTMSTIIDKLMNPNGIDLILAGEYTDGGYMSRPGEFIIKIYMIIKADKSIIWKIFNLKENEYLCSDPDNREKRILCLGGREELAKDLKEFFEEALQRF